MARTFSGKVTFKLHDQLVGHRFEVSTTEDSKLIIWIEDRQSKKQWHTSPLETKDFINEDNAIPKATIGDYAERFAECLGSTENGNDFRSALLTKGGERILILTLPLQWASSGLTLDYKFTMKEVPLERVDILGARMRDIEEQLSSHKDDRVSQLQKENEALKREIEQLSERVKVLGNERAPVFAQATTTINHSNGQNLVWQARKGSNSDAVEFLADGLIRFHASGVYTIDVGVMHASASNQTIFELKKFNEVLASVQGSSSTGHFVTTPRRYILKATDKDEISFVYKASGNAYPGSYIAIVKL